MAQQMLEEVKKTNILLACSYQLSENKSVTIGYSADDLKVVLILSSDKKRLCLSAADFRHVDKEGSLWKIANGAQQRKTIEMENLTLRVTSVRNGQQAVFLHKKCNTRFTLDFIEVVRLLKLRKLVSTYMFTLCVNRCSVTEFYKQYKEKSVERGCYLDFSDFSVPCGIIHRIDYFRLFMEFQSLCPQLNAFQV